MKFDYIINNQFLINDKIFIDEYLPIKIVLKTTEQGEEKIYYQYIDKNDSIIEIKIENKTYQILDINFVGINQVNEYNSLFDTTVDDTTCGIPIFDKSIFKKNYYVTDNSGFEIYRSNANKAIYVKFSNQNHVKEIKTSNHLTFYLDSNNKLISLMINGFSNTEWKELVSAINWTLKSNNKISKKRKSIFNFFSKGTK